MERPEALETRGSTVERPERRVISGETRGSMVERLEALETRGCTLERPEALQWRDQRLYGYGQEIP